MKAVGSRGLPSSFLLSFPPPTSLSFISMQEDVDKKMGVFFTPFLLSSPFFPTPPILCTHLIGKEEDDC